MEAFAIWNDTSVETVDSLIYNVKVAKADRVKTSVERSFIFARLNEHFRALQGLVNANVEQKLTLRDAMTTEREPHGSARSIRKLDNSVKISKLTQ